MRIPSGSTDRTLTFVAVDSTDLKTRETGLSSFTVYRSRNGGAATVYTTPTVSELSAGNMPGVYTLLLDEDTTLTAGHDDEEYVVHITQASMAPVTRSIDIYRPKFTEGQTGTMANSAVDADLERIGGDAQSATDLKDFADAGYDPATNKVQGVVLVDTLTTYTGNTPQTGDSFARIGAPAGASIAADLVVIDNFVDGLETTIGVAGAGLTALATQASVNTIDDFLDTEMAALTTAVADLPTNAELATALGTADDAVLAAVATVDTVVDAIKVKTDQLTFTKANELDVNIQSVNDVTVNGDGAGTPMGV